MKYFLVFLVLALVLTDARIVRVWQNLEKAQRISEEASFEEELLEEPAVRKWALLIAGSNSWYNYRHQADICHAYQILHSHGIPDERIVVMMYDDIANNKENPTPGIIINHPDGDDVYHGVPKDYTGKDVTPTNFLNIMKGDKEAMRGVGSGKVIDSGPDDHVFVYFADHGGTGILAFPNQYPNDTLSVLKLNMALYDMWKAKKYKKLVFYVEACESGSMFMNILQSDMNIYATTASNYDEPSYAIYMDEARDTYLGDAYSVHWMEDSDKENLQQETLNRQFMITKEETNTSHVEEYGDMAIGQMHVSEFQGAKQTPKRRIYPKLPYDAVSSWDVPLQLLKLKHKRAIEDEDDWKHEKVVFRELKQFKQKRHYLKRVMKDLVKKFGFNKWQERKMFHQHPQLDTMEEMMCHDAVTRAFSKHCFDFYKNPHALKYTRVLGNLCDHNMDTDRIIDALKDHCKSVQSFSDGIH